jgi:integrase
MTITIVDSASPSKGSATAPDHRTGRRPMIAAMAKFGLRVTEMCRLRWGDVDVHYERLVIEDAKTDAGNRYVDLSLDVMEELMAWRNSSRPQRTRTSSRRQAVDRATRRTSPVASSVRR